MGDITFFSLPKIPKQVDISDLHAGLLITKEQLTYLINNPNFASERRYTKSETGLPYGVIRHDGMFYVIYKGSKHQKALGEGLRGSAKIVQCVGSASQTPNSEVEGVTGSFYALKLTSRVADVPNEYNALKIVKQTTTSPLGLRHSKKHEAQAPAANAENLQNQGQIIMHLIGGMSLQTFLMLEESHVLNEIMRQEEENENAVLTSANFLMHPALRMQLCISILEAINELHTKYDLVHRDIHTGNILLDRAKQKAFLIDYGMAVKMAPNAKAKLEGASSYAPEYQCILEKHPERVEKVKELEKKLQNLPKNNQGMRKLFQDEIDLVKKDWAYHLEVNVSVAAEAYTAAFACAALNYLDYQDDNHKTYLYQELVDNDETLYLPALPQKQHEAMLAILQRLACDNPVQRCSFKVAINQMKMVLANYIKDHNAQLKAAVVNVQDYLQLDGAQKQAFIESAQQFDEVWLIDTDSAHRKDSLTTYCQVKREIGLAAESGRLGVTVGDIVVTGLPDANKLVEGLEREIKNRPVPVVCERLVPQAMLRFAR